MTKIFNYDLTNQVYNSDNTAAKIAKYSLVGIALVAIVETIKNIVLSPFRIISNFNNSLTKNENGVKPLTKQASLVSEPSKKMSNWKKVALGVAFVALVIAGGTLYQGYISSSTTPPDPDQVQICSRMGVSKEQSSSPMTAQIKKGCKNILAKGFNIANNWQCDKNVTIPGMDPSHYHLDIDESSLKHSYYPDPNNPDQEIKTPLYHCSAVLNEKGKQLVKQKCPRIDYHVDSSSDNSENLGGTVKLWRDGNSWYWY